MSQEFQCIQDLNSKFSNNIQRESLEAVQKWIAEVWSTLNLFFLRKSYKFRLIKSNTRHQKWQLETSIHIELYYHMLSEHKTIFELCNIEIPTMVSHHVLQDLYFYLGLKMKLLWTSDNLQSNLLFRLVIKHFNNLSIERINQYAKFILLYLSKRSSSHHFQSFISISYMIILHNQVVSSNKLLDAPNTLELPLVFIFLLISGNNLVIHITYKIYLAKL